jgi:hypothetical protein
LLLQQLYCPNSAANDKGNCQFRLCRQGDDVDVPRWVAGVRHDDAWRYPKFGSCADHELVTEWVGDLGARHPACRAWCRVPARRAAAPPWNFLRGPLMHFIYQTSRHDFIVSNSVLRCGPHLKVTEYKFSFLSRMRVAMDAEVGAWGRLLVPFCNRLFEFAWGGGGGGRAARIVVARWHRCGPTLQTCI